jgi:hypothetical protein
MQKPIRIVVKKNKHPKLRSKRHYNHRVQQRRRLLQSLPLHPNWPYTQEATFFSKDSSFCGASGQLCRCHASAPPCQVLFVLAPPAQVCHCGPITIQPPVLPDQTLL